MSSINSAASKQPTRQYIAAAAFNANFFTYTITTNPITHVKTGSLTAVAGATAANCPAGSILRENGKKLYPDVHPNVGTYMVGVIQSDTFLSGYIDPNAAVFAMYSTNLPAFYEDGTDPLTGYADEGAPVITNGLVSAGGTIAANGQIRCIGATGVRVPLDGTAATIVIDVTQGSFVFISGNGNNTLSCGNFQFGDHLYIQATGTGNFTFSTGFGVATQVVAKNNMMFTFVCDGVHMLQQGASSWTNTY